ncbi:hypothetical protein PL321_17970 [Caloramator sp. mosi_1]|uniref:hypothetical protein n=1 Tax=Caloramator sp. mosi_1 TaxID=3023090 RepID=UPI00235F841E|nr:hypothetical protein [Caloramator sp. mosi_1]WDC84128.1 hypothetical protein PL321_17970 [Caloramator sp. mosi_1]
MSYKFIDKGLLNLKVNNKLVNENDLLLSEIVEKDEEVELEAEFNFTQDKRMKYNVYRFYIDIEYETFEGKKTKTVLWFLINF